jgi:hypothetical protein
MHLRFYRQIIAGRILHLLTIRSFLIIIFD